MGGPQGHSEPATPPCCQPLSGQEPKAWPEGGKKSQSGSLTGCAVTSCVVLGSLLVTQSMGIGPLTHWVEGEGGGSRSLGEGPPSYLPSDPLKTRLAIKVTDLCTLLLQEEERAAAFLLATFLHSLLGSFFFFFLVLLRYNSPS